jgi:hypothetical protein
MDMKTRSAQPSANGSFSAGANLNSPRPLLYFVRAVDSMRGEGSMPITLAANLSARGSKTRPVPQPTSTMSFGAKWDVRGHQIEPLPHDRGAVAAPRLVAAVVWS